MLWIGCALALVACEPMAPNTPQTRIRQNPQAYMTLNDAQRRLVDSGQIGAGMSKDAVILAWGRPSSIYQGSHGGKDRERWDYAGTRAVQTDRMYSRPFGSPYRYGAPGRGCAYGPGPMFAGPDIEYVPYRVATVWFVNGKVDSWERVR